ncbi:hypothetical protein PGUG_00393 [Meyerozyma guilliermondii ATCC 6260]|uniref:PWWP domain-containing protein n=1 Tax=Meyerozyma guilliermondii (strain ATCC 6260 / CBS 566 / DSM 6381 / JCM 1539 / NBRC 10279 / NRRL Y-324) TaxID=294746 RepID=A5DAT8_PICGU|nr:uncharacterized protein PGUG_00393 [Meyerozyma guilliermondii ATCC 6260]EDK36295.2 hypothetical protein PGUG_00393 [Meyerozyma guilliermondii ATCC 6260]
MVIKQDVGSTPPESSEDNQQPETNQNTSQNIEPTSNGAKSYSPTSVVLAKVKGYPPWPAMVLDESLLPQNILDKRPKNVRQKSGRKGRGKDVTVLPVRFFSDDTYIWIKDNELKPMTQQMIDAHLSSDKKRKDKLLEKAYQLAKNPPDMKEFVTWGSRGPPKNQKLDPEYEEEDVEMEEDLVDEEEVEDDEIEEEEDDDEEDEEIVYGRRRKKQKTAKKEKVTKKVKQDKNELGYDSDWGLTDDEADPESYIFEDEEQQKFDKKFPKAADITERLQEAQEEFQGVSFEITSLLLEEEIDEKEVVRALASVRKLDVPYTLLAKSNLFRVLVLTARKPHDTFPYTKLKKEVNKVLESVFGMKVEENTPEMMEKEEKEATPMPKEENENENEKEKKEEGKEYQKEEKVEDIKVNND